MIRPITVDGALFDHALEALYRGLKDGAADRGEVSFACGVLHTLQHQSAEKAALPVQDPTEPYRREIKVLTAAIKAAGFRVEMLRPNGEARLYPLLPMPSTRDSSCTSAPLPPGPRAADCDPPIESTDDPLVP